MIPILCENFHFYLMTIKRKYITIKVFFHLLVHWMCYGYLDKIANFVSSILTELFEFIRIS